MNYWCNVDPPMSFIPEGWTYEQKREFRFKCIPYLPEFLQAQKYAGKRVLCVGDGSGIDALEFAKNRALVTVIDISEKAFRLTLKHAGEAYAGSNFVGTVEDICETTIRNEWFDAVYSFGVYHHIPNVKKALAQTARVLKPGGEFFGMVYHKDSLLYAYSILARGRREGLSPEVAMQTYSERNPGCPHSVAYSRVELAELFEPYFSSIAMEIKYDVVDLPAKRKVPFSIEGGEDLGWHLCFRAVK